MTFVRHLASSALALAISATLATTAQAGSSKTYVINAGTTWGATQDAAVAASGGTISFRHSASGLAVVESSAKDFAKQLQTRGLIATPDRTVQWQEPTFTQEVAATSGDETFANLQWSLNAVHAQEAWDASGLDGTGVRVAVLDGGVWNTHIDLSARVDAAHSTSFVAGQNYNQDVGTFWHGTHVSGIIAASDNGIGTIGIAPGATIVGVKVLHNGSGSFSAVIEGILYASDPVDSGGGGADIINMSLGAVFPRGDADAGRLVSAIARAVNYATEHNVLVVSAAGNNALDLDHSSKYISVPAQSGSGIAVAATGPIGFAVNYPNGATNYSHPASYTNYGTSAIWVAGPGGDFAYPGTENCSVPAIPAGTVTNACWVFDMVISTVRGSGGSTSSYSWAAGTSMAAPAVAGVAALVKQRFPDITVGDLKNRLAKAAEGKGPYYGKGFVNAYNAVTQP